MDALYAHLHRSMAQPFVWGQSDCMLDVADYLHLLTGYDCATRYRGLYSTALECHRLSGFLDDPVKPFSLCVGEFPLTKTSEPKRGDVGVVSIVDDRRLRSVGAIYLGKNWAAKAEQGLAIGPARDVLAAWTSPHA